MPAPASLHELRNDYKPKLPNVLHLLSLLSPTEDTRKPFQGQDSELTKLFPKTLHLPEIFFSESNSRSHTALKVGVVLSGGPAAGGHSVIAGLFDALQTLNSKSQLFGFLDGPKGIIENKNIEITSQLLAPFRNTGGFNLIGSGRTKIETDKQFISAEETVRTLDLDGLVIIGGDDSNTNGAFLAEFFLSKNCKTQVIGVPKTIDGDLKNEYIETSFGFDSACKTYSELIGNINRDALSQKKYYFFIKLMGRSASHITLECALQTQPNMALIGEEIQKKKMSLAELVNQISNMITQRAEQNKDYGVILIPEGIVEFISEFKKLMDEINSSKELSEESKACFNLLPDEIQKQLLLDRDPHGNVQVSKIESERLLIEMVKKELNERKKKGEYKGTFNAQPLFYGYEGRSCFPSNFDVHYCYALGHVATLLIDNGLTGYMATIKHLSLPVENWQIKGIPLTRMMHFENRNGKLKPVIKKALVDLEGPLFSEFDSKRQSWQLEDQYQFPGPIQFFGPDSINSSITLTLKYCSS